MKIKTIKLQGPVVGFNDDIGVRDSYRIVQITDSLEFAPGAYVHRKQVQELCDNKNWKVTLIPVSR